MTELSSERVRQAILEHTRRLAESAAAADPDTTVPTAPGWSVRDLVEHVGQVHHWNADIVERRIADPMQFLTTYAEMPADPAQWPSWLTESSNRVASAFTEEARAAPIFNPSGDQRSGAEFFMLSSLNETVVHGFDAANAAGRHREVETDVATALISNHLAMLTSPTWGMQRPESAGAIRGNGETLTWIATEGNAWTIHRQPDGATWQSGSGTGADVTVTGPAGVLLQILTRRLTLDADPAVNVEGNAELARHWLENTAHVAD